MFLLFWGIEVIVAEPIKNYVERLVGMDAFTGLNTNANVWTSAILRVQQY